MGREAKGGSLEVIRSMPLSISVPEKEYSDLEDQEGSITHSKQTLLTLGRSVQPTEKPGGGYV